MITKWATSIANKLAELSGEDVSADQLEIYIYGLECFLNTFITIVSVSYTHLTLPTSDLV